MSETYMPLWNIFDFEDKEGTYTLTSVQKQVLANAEIIRVKYHILAREYDQSSTPASTVVNSDGSATITYSVLSTYHFTGEHYKLTFTSTTYTLAKI